MGLYCEFRVRFVSFEGRRGNFVRLGSNSSWTFAETLQMVRVELCVEYVFCFFWVFGGAPKEILETTLILLKVVASKHDLRVRRELLRKE